MYYLLRIDGSRIEVHYGGRSEDEAKESLRYHLRDLELCGYRVLPDVGAPNLYWVSTRVDGETRLYGQLVLVKAL